MPLVTLTPLVKDVARIESGRVEVPLSFSLVLVLV